MTHCFDTDIAKQYGILEAVMINHFLFWLEKNKANGVNFHDGDYWTYNSTAAFQELFPYASKRQIERALNHLRDEDIIKTGNCNEFKYDRTLWYAFTEKGKCISRFGEMDITNMGNGYHQTVTPIPDTDTDTNTNNKTDNSRTTTKRFSPPTVEEVQAYCTERNNSVDPEKFVAYYTSNGWMVGKNHMKNWKSAVITWEKNDKKNAPVKKDEPKWAETEADREFEKFMLGEG